MATELKLDIGTLYAFLLVLARVTGAFIYVPLPGIKAGPEMARAVFALSLTFVLFPSWPVIDARGVNIAILMGWILAEAGIGIAVGLAVAFLTEGFQMGAQIVSLQAGYSFATTIDPTSGADSAVLLSIAQLAAGILFFATGLDRQVLLIFAQSLTLHPPGHLMESPTMVHALIALGGMVFVTGLRLVLPLLGLLLMVESIAGAAGAAECAASSDAAVISHQDAAVAGAAGMAGVDFPESVHAIRRSGAAGSPRAAFVLRARGWRIPAKPNNRLANGLKEPAGRGSFRPRARWLPPGSS